MLQTITIRVTGKVQGVFYRQSTKEKAETLGITGTVRNLPDQTVEVVATGTPEQLDQLTRWCREGPPRALVTELRIAPAPLQNFRDFNIVR